MHVQVLDDTGGFVLYRDGDRLVFVDRGTRWTVWLRFVLGLVTAIVGINGLVQIGLSFGGGGLLVLGLVLLGVAGLAGFGFVRLHRYARRMQARAVSTFVPMLVADLKAQVLLGPGGNVLAPLPEVTFHAVLQATSSAKALECRWPAGRMVVHRGGGMGLTGVGTAVEALRAHGLRASG